MSPLALTSDIQTIQKKTTVTEHECYHTTTLCQERFQTLANIHLAEKFIFCGASPFPCKPGPMLRKKASRRCIKLFLQIGFENIVEMAKIRYIPHTLLQHMAAAYNRLQFVIPYFTNKRQHTVKHMDDSVKPTPELQKELNRRNAREARLQGFCNLFIDDRQAQGDVQGAVLDHIEGRYLSLFVNAPIGIFQCDKEGGLLNVNPKLAAMCGYEDEDHMLDNAAGLGDIFAGPWPAEGLLQRFIDNKESGGVEIKIRGRAGNDLWTVLYVASTPDSTGHTLYWDGFVVDINAQKLIEQSRQNVEHLIRHDVKNPIIGAAGLARSMLKRDQLQGELREIAQMIMEQCSKALDILQHSLDIYRMEQGVYTPEETQVDLEELLASVTGNIQQIADEKGILVQKDIHNSKMIVQGSQRHLETMFTNLVKNAVEASPPEAVVHLTLQKAKAEGFVTVNVTNPGVIPKSIRPVFFEQFTTSGKDDGSGLGTYSARLIARAHGGDMTFTTSRKNGTTLTVNLPLA